MVLASPPRSPVDPDDVNALTQKYIDVSLSNFILKMQYLHIVMVRLLSIFVTEVKYLKYFRLNDLD